jgi:hypothetical protein
LQAVSKAREPSEANRFPSALEMLRALRAFVSEQQLPSMPELRLASAQPSPKAQAVQPTQAATASGTLLDRDDLPPPRAVAAAAPLDFETGHEPFPFEIDAEAPTIRRPSLEDSVVAAQKPASAGTKIAAIVFVLVALCLGAGLLYFAFTARQEVETAHGTTTAPDATPRVEPTPTKSQGTISVKLNGLPRGAVFSVDGRHLGANPFRAPKSTAVHTIRVEAPNHEPFETEVSFSEDQEIAVVMTPIETGETPGQIKAYTKGLKASQRTWKRGPIKLSIKRTPTGPQPESAPDQLRDREVTTPR